MRIDTSISFQIQQSSKKLSNTFQKLSTGKKINSASDDPAGLALATQLAANTNSLKAANNNISVAQGSLEIAQGSLSQTTEDLQRLRELAVQSANGTLSDDDRANLQKEYDQTLGSIDQKASQTSFHGNQLLDGSFSQDVQVGPNGGDTINVNVASASTNALGVASTGISTQASAQDSIAAIDAAIAQVNSSRAEIGAYQNRLEYTSNNNSIQAENIEAARSRAEDLDLAEETSELTKQQIIQKSQIAVANVQNQTLKDIQGSFTRSLKTK